MPDGKYELRSTKYKRKYEVRRTKDEFFNPQPELLNAERGTRNVETRNPKPETANWKLKTDNWQLKTDNWKLTTENWQLKTANLIDSLITNKTRIKLLLRFFLNAGSRSYLRGLETEFGESTNAIRLELNRFEEAGLLVSCMDKNKKMFQANQEHPLFDDIQSIIKKSMGLDQLVEKVVHKLGNVSKAYITGEIAKGLDNKEIDFVLIGDEIDQDYLGNLIGKVEDIIKRKVKCFILRDNQEKEYLTGFPEALLLWEKLIQLRITNEELRIINQCIK